MKILLFGILICWNAMLFAQPLELVKGSKTKQFAQGTGLEISYKDSSCSECWPNRLEGKLDSVSRDSIYLEVFRSKSYESGGRIRKAISIKKEERGIEMVVSKKDILYIRKATCTRQKFNYTMASLAVGTAAISSYFSSHIVTDKESKKRLRMYALSELGAGIILHLLSRKKPKLKVQPTDNQWRIV